MNGPRASSAEAAAAARYRGKARCPWCDSTDTQLASLFGGTISELLFKCRRCHMPFGVMKWDTLEDGGNPVTRSEPEPSGNKPNE